jgi:hypothetical protein
VGSRHNGFVHRFAGLVLRPYDHVAGTSRQVRISDMGSHEMSQDRMRSRDAISRFVATRHLMRSDGI